MPYLELIWWNEDFRTVEFIWILSFWLKKTEFCRALEKEEISGAKFIVDKWDRHNPQEGGGISCVLQDGETFEKAGVNITVMRAPLSKKLQASMRAR